MSAPLAALNDVRPVTGWIPPDWQEFLVMAGAFLLVAGGALAWLFLFRKSRHRRRRRRHHEQRRAPGMTLAQTGGLPPLRPEQKPPPPSDIDV